MKKHYLHYLLWISLLFNIAFLGHFVYRTIEFRNHEKRDKMFGPPPPPHEKGPIQRLKNRDPEMESIRLQNFELRKKFFDGLANESPDYEALSIVADSLISTQNQIEKKITKQFISVRKEMTGEEANQFFNRLTEHADKGCRRIKEKQNRRQK